MALSRRSGNRFQASIWPGFVDAMTGLLLVLMFVLTIFMVVQFVLRETISGQEHELNALSDEVAALADALGLERDTKDQLQSRVTQLSNSLSQSQDQISSQQQLIATLSLERDNANAALVDAETKITSFEAQVAGLLSQRADADVKIKALEGEKTELLSQQEALNQALIQGREERDAQAEAARLAAAQNEAFEALIAQLEAEKTNVESQLKSAQENVSQQEAQKLANAAALAELRMKLENADTELTAMTLLLEEKRREAEETLTLLAAARSAQGDLDSQLVALVAQLNEATQQNSALNTQLEAQTDQNTAELEKLRDELKAALLEKLQAQERSETLLSEKEQRDLLLATAREDLSKERVSSSRAQKQTELLNQQVATLRKQLSDLGAMLDLAEARDQEAQIQLQSLGADLNTALARAVAEERRRRVLEEAERKRLEAETQDLAQYRSEFFGRMRNLLEAQEGVRIEGDRFVFSSEVLFPPGGAELSGLGQREIAKVANILRNISRDIPPEIDWIIRVDGHTDNVPISGEGDFADNWELSQARALSVVKYMSDRFGIPPNRLAANGFGEFQPRNTANTREARAQNRRIELKITEK